MIQGTNVKNKIGVLIKISLIVIWFYMVDILCVSTISIFFKDEITYKGYILNNQYMLTLISKVICFIGLVIVTSKCRIILMNKESKIDVYKVIRYIMYGIIGWGIGIIIVNILLPIFPEYNQIDRLFEGDEHLFRFIVIVIVAPFIEEYIFRGKIQEYLKNEFGIWIAIGIQAIIFAGLHGLVIQQVYALILGIYMGYIKYRENNFTSTFIMHITINAISWYIAVINS